MPFRFYLFAALLLCSVDGWGQKHDYTWVMGYGQNLPHLYLGSFEVRFQGGVADTVDYYRGCYMRNTQTTVSDSSGEQLLFYSNGARILTAHDTMMANGDSINYGREWEYWQGGAYNWLQGIIGLPTDSAPIWNVMHYFVEYNFNSDLLVYPWRIYQTRIDMSRRNGDGEVLYKDKTIIEDTLGSYVTACRHANGRDWWMLASKTSSNCLYTLLVCSDTVIQYPMQCLGTNYYGGDAGQAAFSPDGTKFAWCGGPGGINIYDFDRCSGQLSNPVHLPFYYSPAQSIYQAGLAFSSNSRFLYITQIRYVLQFDTWASNIAGSVDTVGRYLPPPDSTGFQGTFFLAQLAPDGKIYMSASNGIRWFHVINEPDEPGSNCGFVNYGFQLPFYNSAGLPSFPNYRLGALTGSPCDTLRQHDTTSVGIVRMKEATLKVFPNPATDFVVVDYGFTDWSKGDVSLEIVNKLGQVVYAQPLPRYSGFQKIDVSTFSSGVYQVYIRRHHSTIAAGKLVRQ